MHFEENHESIYRHEASALPSEQVDAPHVMQIIILLLHFIVIRR